VLVSLLGHDAHAMTRPPTRAYPIRVDSVWRDGSGIPRRQCLRGRDIPFEFHGRRLSLRSILLQIGQLKLELSSNVPRSEDWPNRSCRSFRIVCLCGVQ
jgi:hypothetical protein